MFLSKERWTDKVLRIEKLERTVYRLNERLQYVEHRREEDALFTRELMKYLKLKATKKPSQGPTWVFEKETK